MKTKNLSRRQFLTLAGSLTAAAALNACVPATGSGVSDDAPAAEAQGISFLVRPDILNAYAAQAAADAWNAEFEQQITLDEPAGWGGYQNSGRDGGR